MEQTLRSLFDYQRFAGNPTLSRIIEATEKKYLHGRELSDDEQEMVSAAGSPMDFSVKLHRNGNLEGN